MFDKLSNEQKNKYEEILEKEKEIYRKKFDKFKNKIFDIPQRPLSGFRLFLSDRMPDLRKEKSNMSNNELIKMIDKEWQDGIIVDKYIYNKDTKINQKIFKKQLLEFEKKGFYTKSKRKEEGEDNNEDEIKSSKRKEFTSNRNLEAILDDDGLCRRCRHNKDLLTKLEEQQLKINELSMKIIRLKRENSKIIFQNKRMYNGILYLGKNSKI